MRIFNFAPGSWRGFPENKLSWSECCSEIVSASVESAGWKVFLGIQTSQGMEVSESKALHFRPAQARYRRPEHIWTTEPKPSYSVS